MNDASKLRSAPVCVDTSVGKLALFPQRFKDIGPFSTLSSDDPPARRLRLYLTSIASRADGAVHDAEQSRIDERSCQQLSDDDLERIAEAYLSMPEVRKIAENAGPTSSPIGRAADEAATVYLDRLLTAGHGRQMEDINGTYESFHKRYGLPLSIALADLDRQASSLRVTVSRFGEGQDLAGPASRGHSASIPDAVGLQKAERQHEGATSSTGSIGTMTARSAILLASLSESATEFVRQFAETSRASEEVIRKWLRIATVGILISAVFSAAAVALSVMSYLQNREMQRMAAQSQAAVLQAVKETAATQENQINSLDEKVRELGARQNALAAAAAPTPATTQAAQDQGGAAATAAAHGPAAAKRGIKRKQTR